MDGELIFWIAFFVGGYGLVLGYLLRIALRKTPDEAPETEGSGPPP